MDEYWDGQGVGQVGDAGTTYRCTASGWEHARQGYTVSLPDGNRGWAEGSWEIVHEQHVPRHILRNQQGGECE